MQDLFTYLTLETTGHKLTYYNLRLLKAEYLSLKVKKSSFHTKPSAFADDYPLKICVLKMLKSQLHVMH